MNLKEFLESDLRNKWIQEENISIYVRKSRRAINGQLISFLDIATVEVDEDYRGKNIFNNYMDTIINDVKENIFVENIMNDTVINTCNRLGFVITTDIIPCVYLLR